MFQESGLSKTQVFGGIGRLQQTTACSPVPVETINDVLNQMFSLADQVDCGARIIADSVSGTIPQPPQSTNGEGVSGSLIDRLRVIRATLASADGNNARARSALGV